MIGEIKWFDGDNGRIESQSVNFEGASPEFRTRAAMLEWFTGVLDNRCDESLSALVGGNSMDDYGFRGRIRSDLTGEIVGEFSMVWENMK